MDKQNETIAMCIRGDGEICNTSCPLMEKCWPNWDNKDAIQE